MWPDKIRRESQLRAKTTYAQRVAASLSMIDTPDGSRRASATGAGEADLEEARLRQQAIGVKLRHMFDQVVNEPVPDEFLEILRRADEKSGKSGE